MKDLIVYVHGKGGSAGEAAYYKTLFPNREVIGFDYRSQTPWEAKKEFLAFFTEQKNVMISSPWLPTASVRILRCPRWMKRWWTGRISSLRSWIWRT